MGGAGLPYSTDSSNWVDFPYANASGVAAAMRIGGLRACMPTIPEREARQSHVNRRCEVPGSPDGITDDFFEGIADPAESLRPFLSRISAIRHRSLNRLIEAVISRW